MAKPKDKEVEQIAAWVRPDVKKWLDDTAWKNRTTRAAMIERLVDLARGNTPPPTGETA